MWEGVGTGKCLTAGGIQVARTAEAFSDMSSSFLPNFVPKRDISEEGTTSLYCLVSPISCFDLEKIIRAMGGGVGN